MPTLELKTPMTDFEDKPLKDIGAVKERTKKDKSGEIVNKTVDELEKEAPVLTYGKTLYNLLQYSVLPKDQTQSALANRYAVKVKNQLAKDKGTWQVTEEELGELIRLLDAVPLVQGSQSNHGACIVFLEDANLKASKAV